MWLLGVALESFVFLRYSGIANRVVAMASGEIRCGGRSVTSGVPGPPTLEVVVLMERLRSQAARTARRIRGIPTDDVPMVLARLSAWDALGDDAGSVSRGRQHRLPVV